MPKNKTQSEDSQLTKNKKKSDVKNTSLRLEKKTLKALKIRAIEEETSVQKLIERLIEDYLNEHSKSS